MIIKSLTMIIKHIIINTYIKTEIKTKLALKPKLEEGVRWLKDSYLVASDSLWSCALK